FVDSVTGFKFGLISNYSQGTGKMNQASTPVSTHGSAVPVGIMIHHFIINFGILWIFENNKTISTNAQMTMAKNSEIMPFYCKSERAIINQYNIVSRTVIFCKLLH